MNETKRRSKKRQKNSKSKLMKCVFYKTSMRQDPEWSFTPELFSAFSSGNPLRKVGHYYLRSDFEVGATFEVEDTKERVCIFGKRAMMVDLYSRMNHAISRYNDNKSSSVNGQSSAALRSRPSWRLL